MSGYFDFGATDFLSFCVYDLLKSIQKKTYGYFAGKYGYA
uniref:Uncharacterized protein n=1 Tax=Arundo donax TaxID=35708 RepID=A0A0A9HFK6_ARUDO